MALHASHALIPRGRRPCARREVSFRKAERSHLCLSQQVRQVMSESLPTISSDTKVASVYQLLLEGRPAVLVVDESNSPRGILTKIDLIDHFSRVQEAAPN